MRDLVQSDFDHLAQALAQLLATWWQVHLVTATHSRAPPTTHAGHADSLNDVQTISALDTGKRIGDRNATRSNQAADNAEH
jgi:hypothetical protein